MEEVGFGFGGGGGEVGGGGGEVGGVAGKLAGWRKEAKRLAAESCRRVNIFKSHFGK